MTILGKPSAHTEENTAQPAEQRLKQYIQPSSPLVINLRGSGHNLRGWTGNLRDPEPNLRIGVLKEAVLKALEHICHIPKSPECQGNP